MQEQPASLPGVAPAAPRGDPHPAARPAHGRTSLLRDPLPHRPTRPALTLPTAPTPNRFRPACSAGLTLLLVRVPPTDAGRSRRAVRCAAVTPAAPARLPLVGIHIPPRSPAWRPASAASGLAPAPACPAGADASHDPRSGSPPSGAPGPGTTVLELRAALPLAPALGMRKRTAAGIAPGRHVGGARRDGTPSRPPHAARTIRQGGDPPPWPATLRAALLPPCAGPAGLAPARASARCAA